jgi:hypothetical protein
MTRFRRNLLFTVHPDAGSDRRLAESETNVGSSSTKGGDTGQCKLQTIDRALTKFLQAESIHNHPIRRHRGGALELRFAKAPHFFLAENRAGRVDSYDPTVQLLSGFNVPLPVAGTVALAGRLHDSDQA